MVQEHILVANPRAIREQLLPLPTPADGYVRVLLLGTTGAGKTTLVRQFLGVRLPTESFPSTASGKTTTAEFEAILRDGAFEAVVTFLSKQEVQVNVEECVLAAAQMYLEGKGDKNAADKLLEHAEQRFRLRYILGDFPARKRHSIGTPTQNEREDEEAQQFAAIIQTYLDTISHLVTKCRENIEADFPHIALDEDDQQLQ